MPYNVSYPHGFHDRSSGVSSPGSSFGLPGRQILFLPVIFLLVELDWIQCYFISLFIMSVPII
jgi:hypothetical protein